MLLMSTWGTSKKASILKGYAVEQHWRQSRQTENILRNNSTISVLGHSKSTGAENFFIVPRTNPLLSALKVKQKIYE